MALIKNHLLSISRPVGGVTSLTHLVKKHTAKGLTSKKGNNTDVKWWPDSESSVVESHRLTWRWRTGQVVFLSNQRPQLLHEYRNKQPRSRHGNNTANDDRSSLTPEATPHDSQQMLCFLSPKSSTPPHPPTPTPRQRSNRKDARH